MNKTGVMLLNLGGPDTLEAVRPFLYNLFSDRDIIPLGPKMLQKPIALMLSLLRSTKTRKTYRLIGGGSPIRRITEAQAAALEKELRETGDIPVFVGMRYRHPFVEDSMVTARSGGIKRLIGLSLYPQFSLATTGSTKKVFEEAAGVHGIKTDFIGSFYDHPLYIEALKELIIDRSRGINGDFHLLFSAHSLPVSFIEQGDPYQDEIKGTVDAVMRALKKEGVDPPYHLSFQSRSGPVRWLGPSTEDKIRELSKKGVKNVLAVPVSFVSDHIETLYEIDILYKKKAETLGIRLERIESLNTNPIFIQALKDLVLQCLDKQRA